MSDDETLERPPGYVELLDLLFADYERQMNEPVPVEWIEARLERNYANDPKKLARMKADLHSWAERRKHGSS